MKTTIRAKTGYRVREVLCIDTGEKGYALYDGQSFIMIALKMSENDMRDNIAENEQFLLFEVFETVKGNKFAYCHDYEINVDYLIKLSEENKK